MNSAVCFFSSKELRNNFIEEAVLMHQVSAGQWSKQCHTPPTTRASIDCSTPRYTALVLRPLGSEEHEHTDRTIMRIAAYAPHGIALHLPFISQYLCESTCGWAHRHAPPNRVNCSRPAPYARSSSMVSSARRDRA